MDQVKHPISFIVVVLTMVAMAVLSTWWTVVAFSGGTMPLIGWESDGDIVEGLLWLCVGEPIALIVLGLPMLVLVPIVEALFNRDS